MTIYVVIGTKENVFQDIVGGEFVAHPDKEIVRIFCNDDKAREFVKSSKLVAGTRKSYGDTVYYSGGYYDMEIESHSVEIN
jgi:hypothetical protein